MNEKINLDLRSLKFIYNKDKFYILPIVIILASVMLFFQAVIPQFKVLLATQKEAKAEQLRLQVLNKNLSVISDTNEDVLNSQLEVLKSALPSTKDIVKMLDSINLTSQKTGVNLGNFSFKPGGLAISGNGEIFPVIRLMIPIQADMVAVKDFVEIISKTFPLSEVNAVSVQNAFSTVGISFYYDLIDPSSFKQDVPISPISQKGLNLINQLKEFGDMSNLSLSMPAATPVGSASAR